MGCEKTFMAAETLVSRLMSFGLNKDEAEIYTFLSASGPTPARLVARRFDLNRMKAYRILKVLEDRELVQKVMGRPVKFMVTPPQKIIERHLNDLRHTLTDLEQNKEQTIREWEKLARGAEQVVKEPRFRIFQGRQQVFEILLQMYERAHDTVRLVTTTSDLSRLGLWGLDDKLKTLTKQGKKVKILTQIDTASWKEVKPYSDFAETRHIALQTPIRFAIIDEGEALTTVAMDDSMSMTTNEDTGLWTDASSYVAAMRIFFDALWSLAPDADSVIQSIKTGEPTPEIKTYTTQEEYAYNFKAMIGKSSRSIDIIARNISALPVTLKELETLTTKGINIRLLTRIDNETPSKISLIADSPIMISENAAVTDLDLLAVDEKEVLLNIPHAKTQKRAVSSNIPAFVSIMQQVFKDYWDFGKPLQEKLRLIERQKKVELLAQRIKKRFEEAGWIANAPGVIVGTSSNTYTFDILVKSPSNNRFCIDIVTNESVYNKIIERSNVVSDIAPNSCFLASLTPFQTSELRLAELYRMSIIHSNTEEGLISSILSTIVK
jgi:sugar-specific transcriptional regulator TrmB